MTTPIVHLTYTRADHRNTTALCGATVHTDHQHTKQVTTGNTGPWLSCPLCEAAKIINNLTTETPPPKPPKPLRTGRRSPTGWTQPTFVGADVW